MTRTVSLEFNEVNFDWIQFYIDRGELPAFRGLIERHGLLHTEAELSVEELEPWIQWPTVHTGKTLAEHKVFRLGDAVEAGHEQIWEYLERHGLRVGAILPINAANRCEAPAFFLPDAWTDTTATCSPDMLKLFATIKGMVQENAADRRSLAGTIAALLPLAAPYLSLRSMPQYLRLARLVRGHRWVRAAILDRLLADIFLSLFRKARPDFASLFLNGAAHVQHHHLFDAACYDGDHRNPSWYSGASARALDPLLIVYRAYDSILSDLLRLPDTRVLLSTGLSQRRNERQQFQYRLRRADQTLRSLGVSDFAVHMRMSRDFLVSFADAEAAARAEAQLLTVSCKGDPLFSIDNRGTSLFCMVAYQDSPEGLAQCALGGVPIDLSAEFVLVSIENAVHRTLGYHVDTALRAEDVRALPLLPLSGLFDRVAEAALAGRGR